MTGNMPPKPVGLVPHLVVNGAIKAIEFYKKAFGATERMVIPTKDGKIMHAELEVGDSPVMLGEENPAWPEMKSAESMGGSPISLAIYVKDVDAGYKQAVAAGAKGLEEPKEAFWGDRYGKVSDPFGYTWMILTHVKDVPVEQMKKAALEFAAHGGR